MNFFLSILAIFHPVLLPTFWLCSTNSFSATPTMVHSEKDACANGTCTATHLWQSRSKWTCQSDNICRLDNYISNYLPVCGTTAEVKAVGWHGGWYALHTFYRVHQFSPWKEIGSAMVMCNWHCQHSIK